MHGADHPRTLDGPIRWAQTGPSTRASRPQSLENIGRLRASVHVADDLAFVELELQRRRRRAATSFEPSASPQSQSGVGPSTQAAREVAESGTSVDLPPLRSRLTKGERRHSRPSGSVAAAVGRPRVGRGGASPYILPPLSRTPRGVEATVRSRDVPPRGTRHSSSTIASTGSAAATSGLLLPAWRYLFPREDLPASVRPQSRVWVQRFVRRVYDKA